MQIADETLMAFADGELDPAEARRVEAAVAADPALQARLRVFSETRRMLREVPAAPMPAGGDAALIARIRAASQPRRPAMTPPAPANLNRRPLAAIAATLAVAVIGLGWWQIGGPQTGETGAGMAALDSLASGEVQALPEGGSLTIIASFITADEEFCREYETRSGDTATLVVACREDDAWKPRFAMSMTAAEGYVPASGEIEALDAFLAETGAGAPLTMDEEAAALSRLR